MLQGYSFAKFGATLSLRRRPARVRQPGASGRATSPAVTAWLVYSANIIVTAMVAVSFGSYAQLDVRRESAAWAKVFAVSSSSP